MRHLCDTFATIWDDSGSRTTKDDKKAMLFDHLQGLIPFYNTLQCYLSLLQPFLTLSDAFRPFATFLDFALFNTLPDCVAFSAHVCHVSVSLPPFAPVSPLACSCSSPPPWLHRFPLGCAHPCSSVLVPACLH